MIDDLKQQISEFVLQVCQIIPFDRIRNLIGFLDGVGGNRRKGLLDIPWTPANRVSQRDHYVDQFLDIP